MSIILIIQIALPTYFFIVSRGIVYADVKHDYKRMLNKYWEDSYIQTTVDAVQVSVSELFSIFVNNVYSYILG